MEAIKTRLKSIAWFLTALMVFQSCVVYHKTPTTLERASQEQVKTKLTKTKGETIKFKYITFENGQFYGVNKKSGEIIKTPLDEQYVETILIKNRTASFLVTVLVIAVPIIVVVILISTADYGLEGANLF